jgi:hypothetical protein
MYEMQNGRAADTQDIDLSPLEGAAVTVDGYSAVLELGDRRVARLVLDVTSVSSGDTVDVTVQTSRDGVTYYTAGTFTQVTAAGTERKLFMLDRYVRAYFDVGGSGVSIACTLTGEAA